ncbi:energy transducer TonB [Campylobacter lanienae]|uniref:energy transducer TonB n=1 Tax=Campylobacter lanienae TaxID=75658 RepID=UPI000BB3F85D|nr:energy transducer TonB [Campylobacter lanienae]
MIRYISNSTKTQSFCLTTILFLPFLWLGLNVLKPITPSISADNSISLSQIIQAPSKQASPAPTHNIEPIIEPIAKPLEAIKKPPIKKPRHRPKPAIKPATKPIPEQVAQMATTNANSQAPLAQVNSAEQIESFNISNSTNHPFLAAIKSAIDKEHRYPRMARKLRQQGEVVVKFTWTKDMKLKFLKIIKGSPYEILNDAALTTILDASKHFPKYDKTIEIQIPLVYKIS